MRPVSFRPVSEGACPTTLDVREVTLQIGKEYELRIGSGDALVHQGQGVPPSTAHRVRPDTPFRFLADSGKVSIRPATSAGTVFWFFEVPHVRCACSVR